MRKLIPVLIVLITALLQPAFAVDQEKRRIFVVSSYHKEYLWSQSTQQGLVRAMRDYGYLDTDEQGETFTREDYVESSTAVIRKTWMDTKRKTSHQQMAVATDRIMRDIREFRADLVLLGDDNAANYIGNQLLDTETPVVFWGINGLPLKYGLIESMDAPGHNVTGVWQAGYHKESVELLKILVPEARTFAILSCDSVSARPNVKRIRALAKRGLLPLELVGEVVTNSFSEFRRGALDMAERVDAFYVLNHDTLTDDDGNHVDMLTVGSWYLNNIHKPEVSHEDQFVREGMLATANDSGYNQSYEAFQMVYDILDQGLNPAHMRTKTPARGPFMVNRKRAEMLGIALLDKQDIIDEIVDEALALN